MKAIFTGGSGMRLYPLARVASKQYHPIYDKSIVYYPMSVLMQVEIF